jgi:hypothetical protein
MFCVSLPGNRLSIDEAICVDTSSFTYAYLNPYRNIEI